MDLKRPSPIRPLPVVLAAGLLWLLTAAAADAGEIYGQAMVLNKTGQALPRFDQTVVFIEGLETPPPAEPAVMDQKSKEFIPRLLPVVRGQEILFLNSDKVQHNVFLPHEQEPFDLGLYPAGESKSLRLKALRRHKVYCNLHKSMAADIFVLPNRYFSLTDESGRYRIRGLPEGDYILWAWHIFGGVERKPIRVGTQPLRVDFTLRSTQSTQEILEHPDKSGKGYSDSSYESY